MDMKKLLLVFAILSLSLVQFSSLVYANDVSGTISEGTEWFLGEALGFPDEWLTVNGFIFNFFVPFIGVWAIILGFLRVIRIFETESRLEYIISFAMAFSTLPLGWFVPFVQWAFGIGGAYATLAFVLLFIVGITAYSLMKGRGYVGTGGLLPWTWGRGGVFDTEHKKLDKEIADKEKKVTDLKLQIAKDIRSGKSVTRAETALRKDEAKLEKLKEARKWVSHA